MKAILPYIALFGGLGQALQYAKLGVVDLKTHKAVGGHVDVNATLAYVGGKLGQNSSPLARRDETHYWGFSFWNKGCHNDIVYASFSRDDGQGTGCLNLVQDKPWDTIEAELGPGYDAYIFAGPDCCTTGLNPPCNIYKGALDKTCISSAGPPRNTGVGFAKSLLVVKHGYTGDNGAANQAACAKPNGANRCPRCPAKREARSSTFTGRSSHEACERAANCELWFNPEIQRNVVRFKKGMDPDSDWYHHNVRLQDSFATSELDQSLSTRDIGCENPATMLGYYADRSMNTTKYGSKTPKDVIGTMTDHCLEHSCSTVAWEVESMENQQVGCVPLNPPYKCFKDVPIKLKLSAHGHWGNSTEKGYYIEAMQRNGVRSKAVMTARELYLDRDYGDREFISTNFLGITRHLANGNMEGFADLQIIREKGDDDTCDKVVGLISAAASDVGVIGAGFFGELLADAVCDSK